MVGCVEVMQGKGPVWPYGIFTTCFTPNLESYFSFSYVLFGKEILTKRNPIIYVWK